MNVLFIIITLALSAFTAYGFIKAGMHKLRTPDQKLIEGGWGWVKSAPKGTTKFIGLAEVAGGLGVFLAPLAVTLFTFNWALPLGIAAAAGLVTIMVLANSVHLVRKEFKYTYKVGLMLLVTTAINLVLLINYPLN